MTIAVKTDKVWLAGKATFLAMVVIFCSYYLLSGYNRLVAWYLHLNSCFYRVAYWDATVFTKDIKADGNVFCIIAIVIAVAGLFYIFHRVKQEVGAKRPIIIELNAYDLLLVIAGIVVAILLWWWGNAMAPAAYDEVFSAQNAAGINPFQCISYYMLPNNHLFYNLLNSVLFHAADDKVFTGRIISLIVYCSFITLMFFWLKRLVGNRWFALIISIVLAMQFQVWGFSFQARGYELYLLCEWGLLISLFTYIRSSDTRWLSLNAICCAIGYFCIPSFFYFHIAQMVFMLLYLLVYRKKESSFWKYQLLAFVVTFLLYLPALCFSGFRMIANNRYVAPLPDCKTIGDFCTHVLPGTTSYFLGHIFSDVQWHGLSFNLVLFLLPVTLLLNRKNKMNVLFGLFYVSLWAMFFVIVIAMKRMPFERNLIGHYSVTFAGVILAIYWLTSLLVTEKTKLLRLVLFPAIMLFFAIHFIRTDKDFLTDELYGFNVKQGYDELNTGLTFIPAGSTVAFSDEAFYGYYICKKNGCKVNKCSTGTEDYFIKQSDEKELLVSLDKYSFVKKIGDYEIYKRR